MKDPVAKVEEVVFAKRYEDIRSVRFAVFVDEQRVPAEIEMDEWDELSRHVLASVGSEVVGTGRLLPDGHIGRVALLRSFRGRGVGLLLMGRLIDMGRAAGLSRLLLSAQVHAIPFYERLGFSVRGPVYEEAGIPHVEMTLDF